MVGLMAGCVLIRTRTPTRIMHARMVTPTRAGTRARALAQPRTEIRDVPLKIPRHLNYYNLSNWTGSTGEQAGLYWPNFTISHA